MKLSNPQRRNQPSCLPFLTSPFLFSSPSLSSPLFFLCFPLFPSLLISFFSHHFLTPLPSSPFSSSSSSSLSFLFLFPSFLPSLYLSLSSFFPLFPSLLPSFLPSLHPALSSFFPFFAFSLTLLLYLPSHCHSLPPLLLPGWFSPYNPSISFFSLSFLSTFYICHPYTLVLKRLSPFTKNYNVFSNVFLGCFFPLICTGIFLTL